MAAARRPLPARRRRRVRLGPAAEARCPRRRPARLRDRRGARGAVPRRGGRRLPVSLRGLRDPHPRGHGLRDGRRRVFAPFHGRGRGCRCRARGSGEPGGDRGRDRGGCAPRRRDLPRGLRRSGGRVRVALDVSPLVQTRAGTARYVRGLLRHLDVEELSFGGASRAATLARDALWYPALGLRRGFDLLHCPSFRGPPAARVPLVVTIHDVAVLRHPEWFNRWTRSYSRLAVPRVVRAAARVIAVSEFSKRELVDLLGVAEAKIRVVPNGIEDVFTPEGPRADGDFTL